MSMDTALIRQRFSAAAASYEAEALAQRHIADRLWTLAAPRVAPQAAVLEIGAGTGLAVGAIAGWPLVAPVLVGTAVGAGIGAATTPKK